MQSVGIVTHILNLALDIWEWLASSPVRCTVEQNFSTDGPRTPQSVFNRSSERVHSWPLSSKGCIVASFKPFSSHFLLSHRSKNMMCFLSMFYIVCILFSQNEWHNFGEGVHGNRKMREVGVRGFQKGYEGVRRTRKLRVKGIRGSQNGCQVVLGSEDFEEHWPRAKMSNFYFVEGQCSNISSWVPHVNLWPLKLGET